jgi:tRNA A-37 threonylcarbamoyl transferase component Bud32
MTQRELIHRFVCNGTLVRALLQEVVDDAFSSRAPNTVNEMGREIASLHELDVLLEAAKEFEPTALEIREWEKPKP